MHIVQKKILEKNEQKMKFVIAETKLHEICKIFCHCYLLISDCLNFKRSNQTFPYYF